MRARAKHDEGASAPSADIANPRIAMVVSGLERGGLERITADLTVALRAEGYDAAVFCLKELGFYAEALRQADVPVWDCRETLVRVRGVPARLIRRLSAFRPAVIHAHSGTWLAAAVAKWFLRYPRLIFTEHGRYPPEPRWRARIERWCNGRTDRLVAVSGPLADYVQEFIGLRRRPDVIHNGVDLNLYHPMPEARRRLLRDQWGAVDQDVVVLAVGRLEPVKNHAVLLRALADSLRAVGTLRLVILGAGSQEVDLRRLAGSLGLGTRIRFLGFRTDVADCLRAADVFVLPSATEGLPMSLLEAMAAGLPTVATRVGGIPDALGNPPAGILVAPNDVDELARALVSMARSPQLRAGLSKLAPPRAAQHSLSACVALYAALYSDVLLPPPPAHGIHG